MVYRHLENLEISATFSDCGKFRYRLKITHPQHGQGKLLCVIMQNPSDADETKADKSVHFLENLIFFRDYPEFREVSDLIIVNQFAYVQKKDFTGSADAIGPDNDLYIRDAVQKANIILIAWGKKNSYRIRQESILKMLQSAPDKQMYKTKKHPSRGTYKDFIEPLVFSTSFIN